MMSGLGPAAASPLVYARLDTLPRRGPLGQSRPGHKSRAAGPPAATGQPPPGSQMKRARKPLRVLWGKPPALSLPAHGPWTGRLTPGVPLPGEAGSAWLGQPEGNETRRERIEGYRRALADAGLLGFENVVVAGRNEAADARQALLPVLAGPGRPSALFAVTQTMTIGALQSLWEAGLELPKDISLLAFDDSEWFTALKPFVSTVRQPTDDFADQAWAMLMARLNNDRSPTLQSEVHASLAIRESTIPYQGPLVTEVVP